MDLSVYCDNKIERTSENSGQLVLPLEITLVYPVLEGNSSVTKAHTGNAVSYREDKTL